MYKVNDVVWFDYYGHIAQGKVTKVVELDNRYVRYVVRGEDVDSHYPRQNRNYLVAPEEMIKLISTEEYYG